MAAKLVSCSQTARDETDPYHRRENHRNTQSPGHRPTESALGWPSAKSQERSTSTKEGLMNAVPSFSTLPSKSSSSLSKHLLSLLAAFCFGMTLAAGRYPALAQQSSSPDQITLPSGGSAVLPVPQPQFRGVIGRKASESTPDFPKDVTAPKGAPNVLLIMRRCRSSSPASLRKSRSSLDPIHSRLNNAVNLNS
jgi:hypothetical protein